MSVIALDTLKYTKKLMLAGVPPRQAEAQAEVLAEMTDEHLATKHDLKELEKNTKQDIKNLETKLEKHIDKLENHIDKLDNKIDGKIDKFQHQIMMRLGSLIMTSIGMATAVLGVLVSIHH